MAGLNESVSRKKDGKIYEDKKGRYRLELVTYYEPCRCHPETCHHFESDLKVTKEVKIYE